MALEEVNIIDFHGGSEEALHFIYKNYYKGLVFFASQLIKIKDDAEDIVQDSILKFWNKRQDFDNVADIKSFLYVTTRNACFNQINANNRHGHAHLEIRYLSTQEKWEDVADMERLLTAARQALYEEIENLPPQCRTIFKLYYIKRQTSAQIADSLGLQIKTVQNQKLRAIELLRTSLFKRGILVMFTCTLILI